MRFTVKPDGVVYINNQFLMLKLTTTRFFEATHEVRSLSQTLRRLNPLFDGLASSEDEEKAMDSCIDELKLIIGPRQKSPPVKPLGDLSNDHFAQITEKYCSDPRFLVLDRLWQENPTLSCQISTKEIKDRTPMQPICLLFKASVESRMLVEYGQRPSPRDPSLSIESPPCMRLGLCVGMTMQLRGFPVGGGCIFMARMTPEELEQHEANGSVPKRLRMNHKEQAAFFESAGRVAPFSYSGSMCVLCSRYEYSRLFITNLASRHEQDPETIRQWCRVPIDTKDGYSSMVCWTPTSHSLSLGVSHAMPIFRHDLLEAFKGNDGKWHVDQSRMLYVPIDKRRDYQHGIRSMPGAAPHLPEPGSRRAADPRASVPYRAQLFRVRSSLPSPSLLRSPRPIDSGLMLKTPLFLLANYWCQFLQRKEEKTPIAHKREPLFEIVAKCFPALDAPQANTLPQRFAKLYAKPVFSRATERKRIFHECAFPMVRIWLLEWSLFYSPPSSERTRLWNHLYSAKSSHEPSRDAWLRKKFASGKEIVAMLRYFLVHAARVMPWLDHFLATQGKGHWKRYRDSLEDLRKQFSASAYEEMLASGSKLAHCLSCAPPFFRVFHRAIMPSKNARVCEFLPPGAQLFKLKPNYELQTQTHPVADLVRDLATRPMATPPVCRNDRRAWTLFRRLALLVRILFDPFPSDYFFDLLALLCISHFHPRCSHKLWVDLARALFKGPVGELMAVVFHQIHSTYSVSLPPETLARQVQAAHLRFSKYNDFRSEQSSWVRSTLVTKFGMPPADMLVVCPRCQGIHCMVNPFVCIGSGKIKTRRGDEVSGFPKVLVDPVFDRVTCRRRDGTRASDCMATNLHALPILGKIQVYDGRVFSMCARPRCSMIVELSRDIWPGFWPMDEHGDLVCSSCFIEMAKTTEEKLAV